MKEMLTNKILNGLPDAEFARLMPLLEPVALSAGERLSEAGETAQFIYFPENSVISCHADMQDGESVEVGMVGFEGMTGITSLLGSRPTAHSLNVSVAGSALRVMKDDFEREILRGVGVKQSLLAYAGEYITQISQRSACAVLHRLEQRLAVWLLLLADRLDTDVIQMTHERMAQHLGVRRAGVTVVAAQMQAVGAISYTRGNLRLEDRRTLAAMACECYGALSVGRQQTAYM
ncbi:MAG: Crp/Fnr family transcriptional regulator [Acidobacteria bacterium]|nr:Crp/Fnr family transcriptional regulator [Acidobacteriota bacterium]